MTRFDILKSLVVVGAVAAIAVVAVPTIPRPTPDPRPVVRQRPVGVRVFYDSAARPRLPMPDGNAIPVASMLNVPRAMQYGDFTWDETGVPMGDPWVRIDLARQTISVFRGANEIGTAVILYGTDGKPTPTGTFPVMQRARMHRSTLYDADMPYMLRLTGAGVAIHASDVLKGRATHGCIGVPEAFAERLFAVMRRGDPVSILSGRQPGA